MKQLLILLILSIFSCKTNKVQHSNEPKLKRSVGTYRVVDNVTTTNDDSQIITYYDKEGNKVKEVTNICGIGCTKFVYKYNTKNKLLSDRVYRDGAPMVFSALTYDDEGNLQTEQVIHFKDQMVDTMLIVSYCEFDEQRNEEIRFKTIDSVIVEKIVVQKEAHQESLKSYFVKGEEYELYSERLITYNEAGKIISNEEEFKKTGEKIRTIYTYTQMNEIEKFSEYRNEELMEQSFHTYENDLLNQSEIHIKFEGEWSKSIIEYVHEFW